MNNTNVDNNNIDNKNVGEHTEEINSNVKDNTTIVNKRSRDMQTKAYMIKFELEGVTRHIELPAPATLDGLKAAVLWAFDLGDGVCTSSYDRRTADSFPTSLNFMYADTAGHLVSCDEDTELASALRLCSEPQPQMTAVRSGTVQHEQRQQEDIRDMNNGPPGHGVRQIYRVAARNLHRRGVPSITPLQVEKIMALLQLDPHRLVVQSLAPAKLLRWELRSEWRRPASPYIVSSRDEEGEVCRWGAGRCPVEVEEGERAEQIGIAEDMARMGLHDDSVASADSDEDVETEDGTAQRQQGSRDKQEDEGCIVSDSTGVRHVDHSGENQSVEDAGGPRRPIHGALAVSGVRLSPWETRPLLVALGVRPHRLVRLGLVSRGSLCGRGTRGWHGPHGSVPHRSPSRRGQRPGPRGHHAPPRHWGAGARHVPGITGLGEAPAACPPYSGGGLRSRLGGGPDVAMPGQVPHGPWRRRPALVHGPPHGPLHDEACGPPPGRPFHGHHPHPAPSCRVYGWAACGVRVRGHHVLGAGSPGGRRFSGEARVGKPRHTDRGRVVIGGGSGHGSAYSPRRRPERRRLIRE